MTIEKYNLIWIWTGEGEPAPFPEVPDLESQEVEVMAGRPFVKNCHPNVMMINAIDAQHFNTVHPMVKTLAGGVKLQAEAKTVIWVSQANELLAGLPPPPFRLATFAIDSTAADAACLRGRNRGRGRGCQLGPSSLFLTRTREAGEWPPGRLLPHPHSEEKTCWPGS